MSQEVMINELFTNREGITKWTDMSSGLSRGAHLLPPFQGSRGMLHPFTWGFTPCYAVVAPLGLSFVIAFFTRGYHPWLGCVHTSGLNFFMNKSNG